MVISSVVFQVSELSERLSIGSLDLSSSSSSEDEEEEEVLHHAVVVGVVEEGTEEHDQEYTIYDHVPLRRESSQFSLNGKKFQSNVVSSVSMVRIFSQILSAKSQW